MDWTKTLGKLGWFLLYSLLGWFAAWLTSSEVKEFVGSNATMVLALNAVSMLIYAAKDWWKHKEPKG